MYSLKGSWVGQTFALAASNGSGERKSRIRRSKEERKAMVESFIQRYQNSNDGNFPSLNLTHKEVGGSFYTVRELVREIIQENKILGPGRFSFGLQEDKTIAEHYPLQSVSAEPQGLLFQTANDSNVVASNDNMELTLHSIGHYTNREGMESVQSSNDHHSDAIGEHLDELVCRKSASEDIVSDHEEHVIMEPSWQSNGHGHDKNETDNGRIVSGFQTNEIRDASDELLAKESVLNGTFEDGESEIIGECKGKPTLPTKEVFLETSPLRPATKEDLGSTSTDSEDLKGTLNNTDTIQVEANNDNPVLAKCSSPDTQSDLVNTRGAADSEISVSDGEPGMVIQPAVVNGVIFQHREVSLNNKVLERPDKSIVKEDSSTLIHDHVDRFPSHSGFTLKTAELSEQVDGLQPKNTPKGTTYAENSNGTNSKNEIEEPTLAVGNDIQRDNKAPKGSSPALDRINLESWKGASRKTLKEETNPLLAIFKVVVHAFVKFWSE